jgi:hypothetical protein
MRTAQQPNRVWKVRPGATNWRELDGETIVLDATESEYLMLNDSATMIWRRLEKGATRQQLVEELERSFEIDAEAADADVAGFLAECVARSWID